MKPLTFESIRNFLRTKKKGKDKDGIGGGIMDASFKRSDSFKRISIRKSYLDRGRKRAALRAKAIGANTGSSLSGSGGSSSSNHHHHHQHCSPTTSSGTIVEELEANPIFKLDRKNDDYYHHHHHNRHHHNHRPATTSSIAQAKANNLPAAMMTVPEVKNGIFIGSLRRNSVAENEDEYNDEEDDDEDVYNGANSHSQSWLDPSRKPLSSSSSSKQETEIQVVSVDFQNSNSSETIYNDVLEEGDYTGCAGANVSNVSVGSLQDDDRSVISEENIYEKADSVRLDQSESKGITFKTFTPAKNYLETNFDTSQEELLDDFPTASSSKKSSDFSSQQNISKTTLIYEDPFDHIHRKQTKNFSGESIVIHISGTDNSNISDRSVGYPPKQEPSVRVEAAEEIIDHYQKEPLGNAKCTYEIFKELQMSKNEPTSPVKKTISRSSSFSEVHYGISTICEDPDQSPEYNKYQSFSFDPEVEMYDDADMISPDSSIPYPLRVKINPFTRQKELYAVNLGRIWKQLNLGQGDDLDMRGNFKKKNESFKSMSSRDSGFSLTLTKPKNIFRRRHAPEGNKDFRFQRNSSRKRKSRRHLAPIASPLELNPTQDHFVKEFEEFCMARRRRMKARKEYADDTFNQEINDLEAFFEEHLKRLKEYYLQRKKINDATLSEIYADMSPTEQTFEFPHPDKRVTNNKKKSKCLFQEVRTFNDEDHHHEEDAYASIGNHRDTEDLFHYPKHWRMTSPRKRTLGRGRNTGRRYKKSDAYKSRKEISLASVFPSVYDSDAIASSVHHGGRSRRQSKQVPPTNPDGTCSYCFKRMRDASRRCSSIASDEFSEQEFLSNCDVCWNCDNHLADCICAPTPSTDYCSCRHALLAAANSESPCGRKKIRRKKSKRKVGKNHSTLRRRCTGSDITQKGYEKKRSRLLQPYMTKGNQGGGGGANNAGNGSSNNGGVGGGGGGGGGVVNMPPYYNLKDQHLQQQTGNGGSGNGGVQISSEGYSYVTEVPSLPSSHHRHSSSHHKSSSSHHHSGSGGGGGGGNNGGSRESGGGGGGGGSSGGGGGGHHQNRTRRTQRRVTHNEKRYHSAGPLASNVKRSGVDLSSQLAALSAEIAAKSNFKGCRPYNKNEQSSILPQSPLLQTRKYSGSGGSAGNSSASSSMEKQKQQQVPLNSRTSSAAATATTGVTSPSHSILQTSANLLAPSAILAAVKSMQGNKVSKSASGNIKTTTTTSNNNNINNNGNSRSKSESPSGTVLGGVGGHTGGGPPGGGRTTGCVVDTTTDDESIPEERISTPDREYNYPRDHINNSREQIIKPPIRDSSVGGGHKNFSDRRPQQNLPPPPHSDTSSAGSPPAVHRKNNYDFTDISDFQRPYVAPDITQFNNTRRGADRVTRYVNISQTDAGDTGTAGRWKVSAKIQQLLNTLKRPKRRPLPEFYEDNDIELEIAANPKDPNAPKPEGSTMSSVQGEQLAVAAQLPRSLEAALQRFGTNSFKSPMATVLDPNGKMTTTLTYGKLLSRAQKIAYALTTKVFSKGPEQITLKPGDRVALVYPNSDPLSFITAWYGCMFRGLVPLPIELPLSSSDTPPQQVGFLLSSCGISVALTSEACLKGLPKSSTGEIAKLKGWPRLHWFVTEHLPKPPKDFNVGNVRIEENASAYVEYTSDKEGSVMGVTVTRQAMMNHCRALTMACHYTEGETSVCVLDFKREVGLWHAVLTSVLNGMHVLFIPYALMKQRPSSWMQLITKHRASCCLVKSRDLHWGLLATKDHKDISLSSLRMLLVADGANPWSLSSCDQFLSVFQSKGLRSDAICPCASSSEVFTVSLRRPGRSSSGFTQSATGRGVLSMAALSHGVVRVDSEDSLTSLTLQDCGQVMPAAQMVVVRSEGTPVLCKTDQVGEICVTSGATGTAYYGLEGLTNTTFKVQPLVDDPDPKDPNTGKPICDEFFVRSGLLGFLGPGGLVFVCGSRDGLMTVTGRKHNADDIIATVLAVEPMRFIYRGRIAVFSIKVLRDERVCVIAEQRPDCSEEESFQWMSRVLQAVDSIHQVGIYCLALVPPNHLPKTPLGGIHLCEARRRFLEGSLHPANVLMCPHTCVTNLPKPREIHQAVQPTTTSSSLSGCGITDTSVGPASVMVGNLVQGNRLAMAQGRDIGLSEDSERKHQLITGVLRWRANSAPDHVLYTLLNSKGAVAKTLTCSELHKRAEKIAALLQERGKIEPGDHVALIFPPGLDLICAFYGCLYLGAVPITIRPPHPQNLITTLPTVRMIVDVSKSGIVLSIQSIIKLLKSREAAASIDPKSWPPILDIDDNPKRKLAAVANSTLDSTAYLDFSVSTCGRLSGVIITNRSLSSVCASLKLACELYPSRHVALCLDPYCGLGFAMWTLISVYSGHHSILIAPYEVEANPSLWLSTLSQYRVRDTFCSYGVIELCTKALSNSIPALKQRNVDLRCVRTCVVVAEERPRVQLTQQFCKLFQALGLNTRCVSTSFGCRVNPAICVQGASSAESAQVYVDLRALRNNRVALVERGAPNSLCLIESGKLLPGVKVIIANPETKGHCGDSHLGEIWVQSPHSANGYFTIYGDETDYNDHFNAKLVTGATTEVYARTGYLGFLRRTECSQAVSILDETTPSIASRDSDTESLHSMSQLQHNLSSISIGNQSGSGTNNQDQELHDAVYVVGALDEVITLRGMNYHPIDIENSVLRCHKKIAECAVFTWTNLLVVVVELDGNESEALDLVPLVTNTVLEEHQLIVGVVVVVDPGVVPINSRGEKQRMHLRDGFLADQLDPIYVAYNM
ncbi:disco-interacting protein 2 isoform X6 [Episyrphus balteatus]|uniref:disco-interacting protein 2 isoform X6 n=1 Tax=Episyrphus balteatus TaxID=286459 RepID=UPI002485E504|nr:disco-interacting protein 2 isoform X6 [Episyrphus balteatus]